MFLWPLWLCALSERARWPSATDDVANMNDVLGMAGRVSTAPDGGVGGVDVADLTERAGVALWAGDRREMWLLLSS